MFFLALWSGKVMDPKVRMKQVSGAWVCSLMMGLAWSVEVSALEGEEADGLGLSVGVGLDSHYVSEGRDNLDGDALAGVTVEGESGGLSGGVWYAESPDRDYTELNLYAGYAFEIGAWEWTVGYTYLDFITDDADDSEVGVGVAYGNLPYGMTFGLEGYYSFDAEGAFFEASVSQETEVEEWLTLAPSLILGWNEGYIADGHDGANHIEVRIEATIALTDAFELGIFAAHTWGLDAEPKVYPDDGPLEDFVYGGIAIRFLN
jgi:hypothetical protein